MDTEYLKRVGLYILGALLSLGLVFYLGYHIWRSFTREVETVPATQTTAQATLDGQGYIFRSETPVYSTVSGKSAVASVKDGESVPAGGEVAKIYSVSAPDIEAKISELEEQAELLASCAAGGSTATLKDSVSIDNDIYTLLAEMRDSADSGNAAGALALRSSFMTSVNKRAVLTGSQGSFDSEIAALRSQISELTSRLGSCLQTVTSPVSGYFYPSVDGYEQVFDAAKLAGATYSSLSQLLSASPVSNGANCVGKTVTESTWYLVLKTDRSSASRYKEGDSCTVNFKSSSVSFDMDVYSVLTDADEALLILTSRLMPEGFDFARVQSVALVTEEYTGLRVPQSAVRVTDGVTGVYILDGSTVRFCAVDILYRSDGICIVSEESGSTVSPEGSEEQVNGEDGGYVRRLGLHDSIITKGKGLYDGRVIGG